MIELKYHPIEWRNGSLRWIDQTKLPRELTYRESSRAFEVEKAILNLEIRGAPLIGIAGAYATVLALLEMASNRLSGELTDDDRERLASIGRVRPTAVNLQFAVSKVLSKLREQPERSAVDVALETALAIQTCEVSACSLIAQNGCHLIQNGYKILTHCNTGPLATGGLGTALGVLIRSAVIESKHFEVFVSETRPLQQGARLTAWELMEWGIPVTLLPDTAIAELMRTVRIDLAIVGADRVTRNGDTANKIGTANIAACAAIQSIPFYTAFPGSTFDLSIVDGTGIPIEFRSGAEVVGQLGYPTGSEPKVWNPAFDVTPAQQISGYITDFGFFTTSHELETAAERRAAGKAKGENYRD